MRMLVLAAALLGAMLGTGGYAASTAPDVVTTYSFTGTCADCYGGDGFGIGALTLRNYVLGTDLAQANFVEFTYNSDLMPNVDITAVDNLSGSLSTLPGPNNVAFQSADFSFIFMSQASSDAIPGGFWCLGTGCAADFGFAHSWAAASAPTALPEPAGWALMVGGFGLAGVALRARRHRLRFPQDVAAQN